MARRKPKSHDVASRGRSYLLLRASAHTRRPIHEDMSLPLRRYPFGVADVVSDVLNNNVMANSPISKVRLKPDTTTGNDAAKRHPGVVPPPMTASTSPLM
jgi:hypothetical protein